LPTRQVGLFLTDAIIDGEADWIAASTILIVAYRFPPGSMHWWTVNPAPYTGPAGRPVD
jgi:hypothetical protein